MAQAKLSEKRKKKIIADYAVEGSYRAAARKNGVSPNTVRRLVLADPESARAAQDKKGACARDILSYMDGQRDTVCSIIGTGLEVLSSPERMANASLRDITTAQVGDKTMMDALIPASEAVAAYTGDSADELFDAAAQAAAQGAEATKQYVSKFGRAKSYGTKTIGTPDAGAVSMSWFFQGLARE